MLSASLLILLYCSVAADSDKLSKKADESIMSVTSQIIEMSQTYMTVLTDLILCDLFKC